MITIQILIIVASFLVISQFTIQSEYLGNSINLSGSNRFLGELLFQHSQQPAEKTVNHKIYDIISRIDANIYALKNANLVQDDLEIVDDGFNSKYTKIMQIPVVLHPEFNELVISWEKYKIYILDNHYKNNNQNLQNNSEVLFLKNGFIDAANILTFSLSNFSAVEIDNLYYFQYVLLFFNICAHLFLLYLILKIITREEKMETQTKSLEIKNKTLIDELTSLLIKKNSIQLTSSLLLQELQETEKITSEHEFVSEKDKVKYFWDNFYKNILNHVEDLEKSRKKFDDEKSYYEQLNQRFKQGVNLLEGKNETLVKNPDTVLDDLRDLINSLSESGRVSPENNRILTDALNNIIDDKLRQNHKPT